MVIYVIYKDGIVINATTLPRIVQDEFKRSADTVQLWEKEKLTRTFKSLKEFNRYINPRPSEDDEAGGNDKYEW